MTTLTNNKKKFAWSIFSVTGQDLLTGCYFTPCVTKNVQASFYFTL